MEVRELLADFERRGIIIEPAGDKLRVQPASLLTDEDRKRIREHKGQIIRTLDLYEQAKVIGHRCEEAGQDLADHLAAFPYLISGAESERKISPARSLIETVTRHGMALRVDEDGRLLFESYGLEWDFLIDALKIHSREIARIVVTTAEARIDVVRADA